MIRRSDGWDARGLTPGLRDEAGPGGAGRRDPDSHEPLVPRVSRCALPRVWNSCGTLLLTSQAYRASLTISSRLSHLFMNPLRIVTSMGPWAHHLPFRIRVCTTFFFRLIIRTTPELSHVAGPESGQRAYQSLVSQVRDPICLATSLSFLRRVDQSACVSNEFFHRREQAQRDLGEALDSVGYSSLTRFLYIIRNALCIRLPFWRDITVISSCL
jgi:hypothetical protein